MSYQHFYADVHIHIGRTLRNQPVKITAARNMTFFQIMQEAACRKGLSMIGIIDAQSPAVQADIEEGLSQGLFREHPDGGIQYQQTTCLLGAELELHEGAGAFHVLVYLPTLAHMKSFTSWLSQSMKNVNLSTQRLYQPARALQEKVKELDGLLIPAHVFTPFKSVYGHAARRLEEIFELSLLDGIELGLSADTEMADQISELRSFSFLSNSDAHSLTNIGREYQVLWMKEASFYEFKLAVHRKAGRRIFANYGLDPRLGKYYRSRCRECHALWEKDARHCHQCGSKKWTKGVYERIQEIKDQETFHPDHRPPYYRQVPLPFIPNIGKKTLQKLLQHFGTEMYVLHYAPLNEIAKVSTVQIAEHIRRGREQKLEVVEGGAGVYGKIK